MNELEKSPILEFFNFLAEIFKQADNFGEVEEISEGKQETLRSFVKKNKKLEKIIVPLKKNLGIK